MSTAYYIKNGVKYPLTGPRGPKGDKGEKGDNGTPIIVLSQSDYDELDPPKEGTLYIVTEAEGGS